MIVELYIINRKMEEARAQQNLEFTPREVRGGRKLDLDLGGGGGGHEREEEYNLVESGGKPVSVNTRGGVACVSWVQGTRCSDWLYRWCRCC